MEFCVLRVCGIIYVMDDNYLTIKETAKALGMSRQSIYNLIDDGRLHVWRNPLLKRGPVRVPRTEVERLRAQIDAARPRP